MLSAFNGKDDCWTGAKYNILQVAMAFPLLINFNSKSTLVTKILREDKHPLAMLSQERLVEALLTCPESKSCIESLRKRKSEAGNEGGRKSKRRKV